MMLTITTFIIWYLTISLVVTVIMLMVGEEVAFEFAWYDLWVGFYYNQDTRTLYFCAIPCCVVISRLRRRGRGA